MDKEEAISLARVFLRDEFAEGSINPAALQKARDDLAHGNTFDVIKVLETLRDRCGEHGFFVLGSPEVSPGQKDQDVDEANSDFRDASLLSEIIDVFKSA